jgi:8-oxo-dGTP diphosphatase
MAAGALLRDQAGNILLVAPNYRDTLDVPGGEVETEESPHAACRREVAEEIGLDRPVGRVLALDWVPSQPGCPEELVIIYDGPYRTARRLPSSRVSPHDSKRRYKNRITLLPTRKRT